MKHSKHKHTLLNKTDVKLNYKHSNDDFSNCSLKCVKKFLNVDTKKFYKPYPIFQGLTEISKYNALFDLITRKKEHLRKISFIKSKYDSYQRKFQVSKQVQCYQQMQYLMLNEPDKYFCSNYNWYYTGGNLILTKLNSYDVLLHAASCTELAFAKLKKKKSKWTLSKKSILNSHDSDIYQLEATTNGIKTIIGVRQKNGILLYDIKIGDTSDIICELIDKQDGDVPVVSMSFNQLNNEEYSSANVNQCLSIWDLRISKQLCEYQVPHKLEKLENDCFGQVAYGSCNELIYINRSNIYLMDKRSNFVSSKTSIGYSKILDCNDRFVNVKPHPNSTLCYVSTFRDILILDLRNKKVINKCSHNFTSAPFISSYCNNSIDNYFSVTSCKSGEKLFLKNRKDEYCIPVVLPNINDSFESYLLQSTNMSMYHNVRNRLEANTTGMCIWPTDDTLTIFSCNILGDIFCQEVSENNFSLKEMNENFKIFNNPRTSTEAVDKLEYIDKVVLNNIDLKLDYVPLNLSNTIKNKRIQDCILDLKKRRKGYSTKIAEVWENVDEETVLDNIEEVPADETVRNWLSYNHQQETISE